MRLTSLRLLRLLTLVALVSGACASKPIDLVRTLKVGDLTTGWFDAGIVDGKNKLVPSVSFTVVNMSDEQFGALQIYTVFRFLNETEELGSSLMLLRDKEALGPKATSKTLVSRAYWGFTGEQPRAQMFLHNQFKDAKVELFAEYGAAPFTRLTEVPIKRQLLTH